MDSEVHALSNDMRLAGYSRPERDSVRVYGLCTGTIEDAIGAEIVQPVLRLVTGWTTVESEFESR
jgi:hypothetical protein